MNILFITPRLPYPLDTGAKIRTFNLLKQTKTSGNNVTLLSFIYSEKENKYADELKKMGIKVITVRGKDSIGFFTIVRALFKGLPLTVAKYRNKKMQIMLKKIIEDEKIDIVHFDHIHLSQYVNVANGIPTIIDEHNIESEILERYAEKESNFLKRIILKNEYKKMVRFERTQCLKASKVLVVSENDRDVLIKLCGNGLVPKVIPNGVDTEYFTTHDAQPRKAPSEQRGKRNTHDEINTQYSIPAFVKTSVGRCTTQDNGNNIVFVGSLDWSPNIDAVVYFSKDILPLMWNKKTDIKFYVVGKNPSREVKKLVERDNRINVTGTVDDVRPYVAKAKVFVVPLRIGGGTRLKILEAMAMGKAVVSTNIGAEGLELKDGEHLLLADTPEDFARKIILLLNNRELRERLEECGRRFVREKYDWKIAGKKLNKIYKKIR
jgi:glycosyltransferase involved in cell wall biosynthesis